MLALYALAASYVSPSVPHGLAPSRRATASVMSTGGAMGHGPMFANNMDMRGHIYEDMRGPYGMNGMMGGGMRGYGGMPGGYGGSFGMSLHNDYGRDMMSYNGGMRGGMRGDMRGDMQNIYVRHDTFGGNGYGGMRGMRGGMRGGRYGPYSQYDMNGMRGGGMRGYDSMRGPGGMHRGDMMRDDMRGYGGMRGSFGMALHNGGMRDEMRDSHSYAQFE